MPRTCVTCRHSQHLEIDRALISGESAQKLAERYGLGRRAIDRHRNHLPTRLAQSPEKAARHSSDLLDRLDVLIRETQTLKSRAESQGDLRAALMAVGKLTDILELLAKVRGEIDGAAINVNVAADDPATLFGYRRFVGETRWLPESKYQLVWNFIRTIEERPTAESTALIVPPEESPLWHDDEEPRLLPEGSVGPIPARSIPDPPATDGERP